MDFDKLALVYRILNSVAVGVLAEFLLLAYGEVLIYSHIQIVQACREAEVAHCDVQSVARGVLYKLACCGNVIEGLALPGRVSVRLEHVVVAGDINVCICIVRRGCHAVGAVLILGKPRARPIGIGNAVDAILAVFTEHFVVSLNGDIVILSDLKAEVDVHARGIAREVDSNSARIAVVCGIQLGQELRNAVENLAVGIYKYLNKVCKQAFVKSDGYEIAGEKQSAEQHVKRTPDTFGQHTRIYDVVVKRLIRRGNRLGYRGCARASEQRRKVEAVKLAVGEEVSKAYQLAHFRHIEICVELSAVDFKPQAAGCGILMQSRLIGNFHIRFNTVKNI